MSKVKIVGNSYQNVSITVDGVEIPCMKADIHISDNAGIVATLTVPAELDISTLNMVLNTAPTSTKSPVNTRFDLPMTGRGCDLRWIPESERERWLNHLLQNETLAIDEKGRLTDHQATVIEMRFNVKLDREHSLSDHGYLKIVKEKPAQSAETDHDYLNSFIKDALSRYDATKSAPHEVAEETIPKQQEAAPDCDCAYCIRK